MDALVRAPLLPAWDAALVPPTFVARRLERDAAAEPRDLKGRVQPSTAHVTVLNRSEFAAALARAQPRRNGCPGNGNGNVIGSPGTLKEQLLQRLLPMVADLPEPLGLGFAKSLSGSGGGGGGGAPSEAYFVALCWPSGQAVRAACGLP